jgi:hypothetical protein
MRPERTKPPTPEVAEELDDRLELLMALVHAFAQPVPEYEPEFRHVRDRLSAHQVAAN